MPFINTRLNIPLPSDKEAAIKEKFGEAIQIFPGKSEAWLMLNFSDRERMWFRGSNDLPIAYVEIQLFGTATEESCAQMTATVCRIFEDTLGISPEHIYVKYEFVPVWGWNRENF